MRSAPSVRYPVGRSAFHGFLLTVLCVIGGMAVVSVVIWAGTIPGAVVGMAWLLWSAGATSNWMRQPNGEIAWKTSAPGLDRLRSEGAWSWLSLAYQEGVVLARVERVYDFQMAVLLRLHNPDGARSWVWAERRRDPAHWDDLRRALWAHA